MFSFPAFSLPCLLVRLNYMQNYFFNETSNAFEVYASSRMDAGDEVFICYGNSGLCPFLCLLLPFLLRSGAVGGPMLLLNYGFVQASNPYDSVTLSAAPLEVDGHLAQKQLLLSQAGLPQSHFSVP
jgi:hypothetical protein